MTYSLSSAVTLFFERESDEEVRSFICEYTVRTGSRLERILFLNTSVKLIRAVRVSGLITWPLCEAALKRHSLIGTLKTVRQRMIDAEYVVEERVENYVAPPPKPAGDGEDDGKKRKKPKRMGSLGHAHQLNGDEEDEGDETGLDMDAELDAELGEGDVNVLMTGEVADAEEELLQ